MLEPYQVVDLFAGPGGLAEGFSACARPDGSRPFQVVLSVEKDRAAHSTLRLRAFLRKFRTRFPQAYYDAINARQPQPDWSSSHPDEWQSAELEAQQLELGNVRANQLVASRINAIRRNSGDRTILIGGPPCQAYSLVGRARNQGTAGYRAEDDGRHFLYKEYISVLERLRPAAFVMENVKGILSSKVGGDLVLARILDDLRNAGRTGYVLVPIAATAEAEDGLQEPAPADFIVRSEDFGIPQARHRVIVVGIRKDLVSSELAGRLRLRLAPSVKVGAGSVLVGLPPLRSGLSDLTDHGDVWRRTVAAAMKSAIRAIVDDGGSAALLRATRSLLRQFGKTDPLLERTGSGRPKVADTCPPILAQWLLDRRIQSAPNHETRGHMASDLARYFFCAAFANVNGRSPRADDFPAGLAPDHANWRSGKFVDRFKVQVPSLPSSTVTSHISKDGHYFIHPDPLQCRSLTVREAARLQTFPDNYLFLGNRTQQYVQVGNAVPPLLANVIAKHLLALLEPRERPASSASSPARRVALADR